MKIYLAGNVALVSRERENRKLYKNRLVSYFYILPGQIEHDVFQWISSFTKKDDRK